MRERDTLAPELIGYLTFDARASRATLVVCGRKGRPLRRVALEPIGAIACLIRRIALYFGRYHRACRAIAREDHDARIFPVWERNDHSFIISDSHGESWMQSVDARALAALQQSRVIPNPEVIRVVRRYGFGDASRN